MIQIIYILLISFSYASDFIPSNNSNLNYTQVLFKWPQISNVEYYKLYLSNDLQDSTEVSSLTNSILIDNFFNWGNQYYWNVCGIDSLDEVVYCYEYQSFLINDLPDYYPDTIELLVLEDGYYDGITILDFDSIGFSAAINQFGEPVWFVDKENFDDSVFLPKILVTDLLSSGNFIGMGQGKGYEFDINGNIIFQTPDNYSVHHHFIKNDSTYFLIDASRELHPCPDDCPDNLPDNIYWKGDQFIELNSNGELIWLWDTFDYIDLLDYNPLYLDRLSNSYPQDDAMDWTHSNSIFYHQNNIFVSVRNLSRIIKIDYETKDIIWHLGNENFMSQTYFNNNIEFSGQHSVQVLDDNNILFFDNHSLLEPEISKCIEFSYDEVNDSVNLVWEYTLPDSLFTGSRGDCDRLNNGNTLINVGRTGNLIEINNNYDIVWHLKMTDNNLARVDVASFRALRVEDLYPLFFSFKMDNVDGYYIDQSYNINYSDTISGIIYNKGWEPQSYSYSLLDHSGNLIYNNVINLNSNDSGFILIPIGELTIDDSQYTIRVNPYNNNSLYQEMVFYINNSILGDINNDYIINVLDAIGLINLILSLEYNYSVDLNSDDTLDILDVILIINIILEQN
jgi:hypothetical protein